ncbi:hypothetical protein K0M31_011987 [Melipona bicolor]|uniref:Uncharacterized protein n=1 Tax=Melipona bicolor TaxID=60889 RepID=A0AA40GAL7_9HYME|nr:hypothetical protein K0M31_011987 [Melipona bicolor]
MRRNESEANKESRGRDEREHRRFDGPLSGEDFQFQGGEKGDKGFPLSFFKFEFPGSNCPAAESPGQANNGGTYLAEQHSIKHGGNNSRRKKECVGSESATPAVDNIVPSRH